MASAQTDSTTLATAQHAIFDLILWNGMEI
jgi:hypothetical protein